MRRGARTTRSSPGTAGIEHACLSDEDLGLTGFRHEVGASARGPGGFFPSYGASAHGCQKVANGAYCPFEAYRYRR